MGSTYSVDMLNKERMSVPGKTEQDYTRLHTVTQTGMQFKAYELSIPRISHLLFSDHSPLQTDKRMESETVNKETAMHLLPF